MSNAWSFSSFGLEEETLKENEKDSDSNIETVDNTDTIFNDSNGDQDIFFTDKPRRPMMMKNKPIRRFLPDFSKQCNTDFKVDAIQSGIEANMVLGKRHSGNETNKCKWTKSKVNAVSSRFLVKAKEMREFFRLTDDPVINEFLKMDSCKRIADKETFLHPQYLIAMVFAYFKRADFDIQDYSRTNFFVALYLANDVEEDEEEIKYEILPWALGKHWRETYIDFLRKRDWLFRRIDYKAIISRKCCHEIMNIEPDHSLWKRDRGLHHAGAIRGYMKDPRDNGIPRGPDASPLLCPECDAECDSQYDSSSPNSLAWLISPGVSSNNS